MQIIKNIANNAVLEYHFSVNKRMTTKRALS